MDIAWWKSGKLDWLDLEIQNRWQSGFFRVSCLQLCRLPGSFPTTLFYHPCMMIATYRRKGKNSAEAKWLQLATLVLSVFRAQQHYARWLIWSFATSGLFSKFYSWFYLSVSVAHCRFYYQLANYKWRGLMISSIFSYPSI